ncbi:MAG TPA: GAF domain-containing sensor histidine kinase [Thermoanaerobaculia bacterium]|jgi:signal transduction histidine kinase|nr:GAF domain-containing sensor histidine kinase [Thermoanaerobaculia bacterium]
MPDGRDPRRHAPEPDGPAALRRLRWTALLAALVFIVVLDFVRRQLYPYLPTLQGKVVMGAAVLTGCLFLIGALFSVIERMQNRLALRNRELLALHEAALGIYGELSLETVLQKVVDRACSLVNARYGALSVIDSENRIESFITSGISDEERARIGPPPVGHGVLGEVLLEGHRLRLANLQSHPGSVGFPPHHPPMKTLLAVPILCKSPFRGNLYLAEKADGAEFSEEEEQTLVRFATKAAIAIDNSHLHLRLNDLAVAEERLRIAHEMHDGLAQVLAYVNTKAQAVKQFLRTGRTEEAEKHLDQLAGAAREVYADVRESIIGLRSAAVPGRSVTDALQEYVDTWQAYAGVDCLLAVQGEPRLTPNAQLQVLRIVQESLANVRKHAGARRVDVTLEQGETRLRVTVKDDGAGFTPGELGRSELPRFGLSTMRERAESLGGAFRLESSPGAGTRVTVELPTQPPPNP